MSGGVYNVFDTAHFAPQDVEVPDELLGIILKLKPSDGEAMELEAETACMSEKLKQLALLHGPSAVLECPVKKASLSKVIEYMKHHKDNPPAEVRTPLQSDNIADCGVSKWDASFVKLDKEGLFELMYAAGTMGLRSLTFLCCMQAALVTNGKSADKLRKEFGLKSDMPQEEEEQVTGTYSEMASRKRFPPDAEALGAFAAVLHGVQSAAERNGGLAAGASEAPAAASIDLRSWRANAWRAMVLQDWQQLFNVPDTVRADRELLFSAVEQSKGAALHLAADSLKADRGLVLRAAGLSGDMLEAAAEPLKDDRDFVLDAMLAGDGSALKGASERLRRDRELILAAASKGKGKALLGAAEHLRSDERFVLEVLKRDATAFPHAAEGLRESRDFALAAAKRNGAVLGQLPAALRADREVVLAAMTQTGSAAAFAHSSRLSELVGPELSMPQQSARPKDNAPIYMGVPLTAEAKAQGLTYVTVKEQKYIMFTALSTITPNMGQANYIAANAAMDKMPFYSRPEVDTVGIMWGTVGGMGMRFKAFGSQDFMNMTPDNLLSINDCCKILHVVSTLQDTPEWFAANFFDEGTRNAMLAPTAGMIRGSETVRTPASPMERARAPTARTARDKVKTEEERSATDEVKAGPLAGWPTVASLGRETVTKPAVLSQPGKGFYEGAPVILTGIKTAMNGASGTLLQIYPEGKCRVSLDNGKGNALLKSEHLQVVMAA